MELKRERFSDIDLTDPFFDSLKNDYAEFSDWFLRKADSHAYTFKNNAGLLEAFLYLKQESGSLDDVSPSLPPANRIKIGTFKINPHGTKLGERFIKKILDHATFENAEEVYVTVFEKHEALVNLFAKYGFTQRAEKTTENGTELVMVRAMDGSGSDILERYPFVDTHNRKFYLLAIYPEFHTRLFPDSILNNESFDVVQDISHTNSIHKIYLTGMPGVDRIQRGDALVIYRTSDGNGPAHYRSVATSIAVVEEYRNINSFTNQDDFLTYCKPHSVFSEDELRSYWRQRRYPHIVKMIYNIALAKRVTRGKMLEELGFSADQRWSFFEITRSQFDAVLSAGEINENLIIN